MLNWIIRNRTVWSVNCVPTNYWCFTELLAIHSNSWNYLNLSYVCKSYISHHHHHVALVARISLTLSRHSFLSFIALGRSSEQHSVSSHSCWMYVRAGRPAFARPCVGVHNSTSLMSSSLLLQQCPACLVRLTWIVFVIVQLVSCGVLPPGLVQDCTQHSCVIAV